MTARLLNGLYLPTAYSASTQASGYAASNAGTPAILRPWRSTTYGSQYVQFDLGANVLVSAFAVDAITIIGNNAFPLTVTVLADTTNPPTTSRGAISLGADANGRTKGSLIITQTSLRYVRFVLGGGISGNTYELGFAAVFAQATPLACDPLFGGSSITNLDPQVRNELTNGVVETYNAGPPVAELELGFRGKTSDDIEATRRLARAGVCWFDFGLTDRSRQWPVRHNEAQTQRKLDGFNREAVSIKLREVA